VEFQPGEKYLDGWTLKRTVHPACANQHPLAPPNGNGRHTRVSLDELYSDLWRHLLPYTEQLLRKKEDVNAALS